MIYRHPIKAAGRTASDGFYRLEFVPLVDILPLKVAGRHLLASDGLNRKLIAGVFFFFFSIPLGLSHAHYSSCDFRVKAGNPALIHVLQATHKYGAKI